MTADIGNLALAGSIVAAAVGILMAIASVRFESDRAWRAARCCVGLLVAFITIACIALLVAIVRSDFRLAYVASYTELALPIGYKLAAFWAGQEGSLLLWAWLLVLFSGLAVLRNCRKRGIESAVTLAVLAVVCGFFAALMLSAANPFSLAPSPPSDGHGLNPLLQNPAMIAHPPLLFVGYAGFTVPFAMMIGALVGRRRDSDWLVPVRRWVLVSWLFLTAGIVLGAQWAYMELGWGGYWAWDPVENASLLPWLTGTALLHSLIIQKERGLFRLWNAGLIAASFLLCIFGTYLTRSGVIQSVHAFGESPVGTFFLGFMAVALPATVGVILWRLRYLKSEHRIEHLISKEGFFLGINILLTLIMLVTLVGTIFPLISSAILSKQITAGAAFYNKVVLPLALLLLAMMTVGPLLLYGREAAARLGRRLILPAVIAACGLLVMVLFSITSLWALVCGAIAIMAVSVMADDLIRVWFKRAKDHHENPLVALLRVIDMRHRRYGAQLAHLGMILMVIGIAGSSLFNVKETLQVHPGHKEQVGRYLLTFHSLSEVRGTNFTAVDAHVTLQDASGVSTDLHPQMRYYDKSEQAHTQVALHWSLARDVYVTLAGWEDGGKIVALQIIINPLVIWIWIGGIVLSIGAIVCLLPRLLPRTATYRATVCVAVGHPITLHGHAP